MHLDLDNKVTRFILVLLLIVYFVSMVIYPLCDGKSWDHVQDVWHSWQSFNSGVLLFVSSIAVYQSTKYFEREQRKRNFVAARAFLPNTLSKFSNYFERCAAVLMLAWESGNLTSAAVRLPLGTKIPKLPSSYEEIFEKCIKFADPDFGKYLAYILSQLQIHHSRLDDLLECSNENTHFPLARLEIKYYLYRLAELRALLNKMFPYIRGEVESFDCKSLWLDLNDFENAYGNLDIYPEDFEDLLEYTERQIPRDAEKFKNGLFES